MGDVYNEAYGIPARAEGDAGVPTEAAMKDALDEVTLIVRQLEEGLVDVREAFDKVVLAVEDTLRGGGG